MPVYGISGSEASCIYILNTCFGCPAVYTPTISKGPVMGQTLYFKLNKFLRFFICRLSKSECASPVCCRAPSVIDEGSYILRHLQMRTFSKIWRPALREHYSLSLCPARLWGPERILPRGPFPLGRRRFPPLSASQ